MTSTLEKWSVHHLKRLVAILDDADAMQLTQTALNLSSPEQVVAHFSSFLGDDAGSAGFISEFNARRFPPSQRASVPSKRAEGAVRPGSRQDRPEKKADAGSNNGRKPVGNTVMTSDLGTSRPKGKVQPASSTTKTSKVKKVDALGEIDAALRELELDTTTGAGTTTSGAGAKTLSCDCAGRRHGLNPVAPNCLSCGKIVCAIESFARCSFCHAELLDRHARSEIIAELKRERGVETAGARQQQQKRKATAGSGAKMAYSGKLGASYGSTTTNASRMDEAELVRKTEAAERRKDDLLAHVQSGYRRTVIDQASDFTSESTDKWSTPQERALALRRAQAAMHADDDRGRVISLSLGAGGKATIKNERRARRTEEEVDAGIAREQRKIDEDRQREEERQAEVNGSYTRNKLIGSLGRITFPTDNENDGVRQDWWSRGQKGWRRVQDDDDETTDLGESLLLSSEAVDGQPGREEELGTSKRS